MVWVRLSYPEPNATPPIPLMCMTGSVTEREKETVRVPRLQMLPVEEGAQVPACTVYFTAGELVGMVGL